MRVHLDPHTGQALTPEQVPAYLSHPANHGRVVQLVPMLTFDSTRANVPSGAGRADAAAALVAIGVLFLHGRRARR